MTLSAWRSALLRAGMSAPLIALGCTLLAWGAYPGFNNATQYLSELGGPKAHLPLLFNIGLAAVGLGGAAAGAGFALAVPALGGGRIGGLAVGACFLVAAVGLVQAAIYPWPDPRHLAILLGLGIQLAPLALLWALWNVEGMGRLRRFLAVAFVFMLVLTGLTRHLLLPHLVNDDNVGWWERVYTIVLVGWGGVAALLIEQRLIALTQAETGA